MIIPSFDGISQAYARSWALEVFRRYEEGHARATEFLDKVQPGFRKMLVKCIAYNHIAWRRLKRLIWLLEQWSTPASGERFTIQNLRYCTSVLENTYGATGFEALTTEEFSFMLEEPSKEGPSPGRVSRLGLGLPSDPPPAGLEAPGACNLEDVFEP